MPVTAVLTHLFGLGLLVMFLGLLVLLAVMAVADAAHDMRTAREERAAREQAAAQPVPDEGPWLTDDIDWSPWANTTN